jgi:hypothetical protein
MVRSDAETLRALHAHVAKVAETAHALSFDSESTEVLEFWLGWVEGLDSPSFYLRKQHRVQPFEGQSPEYCHSGSWSYLELGKVSDWWLGDCIGDCFFAASCAISANSSPGLHSPVLIWETSSRIKAGDTAAKEPHHPQSSSAALSNKLPTNQHSLQTTFF